jgi:glycosyltransferase 2 family protein
MRLGRGGRLALGGVLALGLLALFFRGVEWAALLAAFRSAHPGYLAGVVLATLLTYAARSWRWGFLLAPLAPVPFRRLFSVTVLGFMTGLVIPRAGEVVRPYLIGRRYSVSTSSAFASIILERLFDLLTVVLLFGLYLYVLPTPAAQTRGPLIGLLKVGGAFAGVGALLITALLALFHAHADRAMAILDRLLGWLPQRIAGAVSRALRSFGAGLAVLQAPLPHLLAIAAQSLLTWLAIALTVFWTNRAFGIDLPFHSAFLIIGFLTVGVAVPTPGMVGGFHEAFKLALTQTYGVDAELAVAAGIAMHALTNLPILVLGLAFLGEEGLTFGRVAEMTEEKSE